MMYKYVQQCLNILGWVVKQVAQEAKRLESLHNGCYIAFLVVFLFRIFQSEPFIFHGICNLWGAQTVHGTCSRVF